MESGTRPGAPAPGRTDAGAATRVHWLIRVLEREGLGDGASVELDLSLTTADLWRTVTTRLGLDESELAEAVARYFRLETARLDTADPGVGSLVPESLARRHLVLPLAETERQLYVATCDPTDVEAERVVGFRSGRTPVFRIAGPDQIQAAIDTRFRGAPTAIFSDLGGSTDQVRLLDDRGPELISKEDASATPVVKLTNLLLRDGIAAGASDIHLEPGRGIGVVRFRVDGVLRKHMDLPMAALNRVVSRVKILSRLDIADRLRPQDGKARVQIEDQVYDLRISTLPAAGAEKCVLRILDSTRRFTLDDLRLGDRELSELRGLLGARAGIIVVTGPTGSGKTTTLYGALRELADGPVNIMTVEDPIEYEVSEITQTQVEVKQGVTFASTLRAILRQDPDVILLGEIRDQETAEVAAQAALTGHLVLATVHANDAIGAVARLSDLGLDHGTIASSLIGCVAQRLVRELCPSCASELQGPPEGQEAELAQRHGVQATRAAAGCADCGFTGYRGRLPVLEVLRVTSDVRKAIDRGKGAATLAHLAERSGMRSMLEVGHDLVQSGLTDLVEVDRVLGEAIRGAPGAERTGPPRIAVVDDDDEARVLIRSLLQAHGFEVQEFSDGDSLLEHLKEDRGVSLVVLDLTMPGLDGREVLNRLRSSRRTVALPVLVRTGAMDPETEADLFERGADDFVLKKSDPIRFVARVKAILRRSAL